MPSRVRQRALRALRLLGLGLLWVFLLVVILISATLQIATLPAGRERVRQLALSQLRPLVPGLELGYWDGDVISELVLGQLSLADRFGRPVLRLERLTLRYDLLALLRQELHVELVEIHHPEVDVRPTVSGALNVSELLTPQPATDEPPGEPSSFSLRLDRLALLNGQATYAAEPPQQVRVSDLQLQAAAGLAGDKLSLRLARLDGRVTLPDGRVLQLDSTSQVGLHALTLASGLQLKVVGLGQGQGVASLALEAKGPLDRLQLDLRLGLPARGQLRLTGRLGLLADQPSYDLELSGQRLDPGSILPELPRGELNATVALSGQGIPLQASSSARLTLDVQPSQALGYRLDALHAEAALQGDRWRLIDLRARSGSLQLQAQASGDLTQVEGKLTVSAPELASLPLPAGAPRITGAAKVSAAVEGPFAGPLRAELDLSAQRLALPPLTVGRLELRGAGEDVTGAPRGQLRLALQDLRLGPNQPHIEQLTLTAQGDRKALALELHASGPGIAAELATSVKLDPARIDLDLQRLALAWQGQQLRLLGGGKVRYWLDRRLELGPTRLALFGGQLTAAAKLSAAGKLRGELQLELAGLHPHPKLPLSASLSARITPRQLTAQVSGKVDGSRSRLQLEAQLPLRYARGSQIPKLALIEALAGSLQLQDLDLSLIEQLGLVPPTAGPLAGALDAKLTLEGTAQAPRADLSVSGRDLRVQGLPPGQAALTLKLSPAGVGSTLRLRLADSEIAALTLSTSADPLRIARAPQRWREALAQADLELQAKLGPLDLETLRELAPQLAQISGTVALDLHASGAMVRPRLALVARLDQAVVAGQALGDLEADLNGRLSDQPFTLALRRNGAALLSAQGVVPLSEEQLLTGRLPPQLPLQLNVELRPLALAELRPFLPQAPEFSGSLSGKAKLQGTLAAPVGSAELSLANLQLAGVALGALAATARYDGRSLGSTLQLTQGGKAALTAAVELGLTGKHPLQAWVKAPGLSLAPLQQLVPLVERSDGTLQLDLRAAGSLRQPLLSGKLALQAKELRLTGTPSFEEVGLQLEVHPQRLKLVQLAASSGGGTFKASGHINLAGLTPEAFYLQAQANRFKLGYGPIQETRYSGPLRVKGSLRQGKLQADVLIDEGSIRVPQMADQPNLHAAELPEVVFVDGRTAPAAAGASAPDSQPAASGDPPALPLALKVRARTTPLFVRSEELDLEVESDVTARSDDQGRVRLYGTIQIRRGWIELLGYRYQVRQASVSLDGQPDPDPALDILLSRQIADITLFIALRGTAKSPELVLRSDPPTYDTSQLLSMILTGRPELSSGEETDQKMALASAVSQALFGGLVRKIVPKTLVDTARVSVDERSESGESTLRGKLELGRHLTERLYLGFRRVFFGAQIDENVNEGLLEYRISARWLLQALFGDAGVGGLDLLWTYRY